MVRSASAAGAGGQVRILADDETAGRRVIGRGEIRFLARLGGDGERGDGGVAGILVERGDERVPTAALNGAGKLQLLANGPRQIDVEAGDRAVRQREIEGRIIILGQKADLLDRAEVRLLQLAGRVPEGGRDGGGGFRGAGRRDRHQLRRDERCKAEACQIRFCAKLQPQFFSRRSFEASQPHDAVGARASRRLAYERKSGR